MAAGGKKSEQMQADAERILPVYIVVDTSWSMSQDGKIEAANEIAPTIQEFCIQNPLLEHKARFSVLEFADEADLVIPMSKGSRISEILFDAGGATNFSRMFRKLHDVIERDYQSFRSDDLRVHRPVAFIITDGEPSDSTSERNAAHSDLVSRSFSRRPQIVMLGVGNDVTPATLSAYATKTKDGQPHAYLTVGSGAAATVLSSMVEGILGTIVNTVTNASSAADTPLDGFPDITIDPLEADDGEWTQLLD